MNYSRRQAAVDITEGWGSSICVTDRYYKKQRE